MLIGSSSIMHDKNTQKHVTLTFDLWLGKSSYTFMQNFIKRSATVPEFRGQ